MNGISNTITQCTSMPLIMCTHAPRRCNAFPSQTHLVAGAFQQYNTPEFQLSRIPAFQHSSSLAFQHSRILAFQHSRSSSIPAFQNPSFPTLQHSSIPAFQNPSSPALQLLSHTCWESNPIGEGSSCSVVVHPRATPSK